MGTMIILQFRFISKPFYYSCTFDCHSALMCSHSCQWLHSTGTHCTSHTAQQPVTKPLDVSVHSTNTTWNCSICFPFLKGHSCILTDRGQRWGGNLHTGAIVQYSAVGTHADWAAGAKQTQPLTLLPVTWVGHYDIKQHMIHEWSN